MLLKPSLRHIAFKELSLFFSSPIAYLFLGVFVAITLFIFFWFESFFSRNIADVRPMFEWMPILLILLSAALTMRMWSEERRSGTLEHVLTLPVSPWQFVLGKFAACKTLLLIALALTLPLPITISLIANLDWGPVVSAYIATILLGSAYISIGLYISARSDNQIVSLILTVLVCSIFYLAGSTTITDLVGNENSSLLRSLGTGSRFESITRGVLDLRDFYYYITITLVFLALNRYSLEKERWASDGNIIHHYRWKLLTGLLIGNLVLANVWLAPLGFLRIDTTEGKIYSISDASKSYIEQLQEPLLIRGYFSAKTHPLLAPLVPDLQDLLKEYQEESGDNIRIEIVDPAKNAEAEEEAGSKYGIRPTPFRIDDRYQSSVVNSYFNVLIQYGDEYKVLSFQELIEVKAAGEGDIDVKLRNPEYDITNAIKQVLYAYQSGGNLFDNIKDKLGFTAYISNEAKLPDSLKSFVPIVKSTLQAAEKDSNGKLSFNLIDPDVNGGAVAKEIAETFGFQPMASSIFDTNTFYFYLLLTNNDIAVQIPLPEGLTEDGLKRGLDSALKRFAAGFTKTIGVVAPEQNPYAAQMGQPPGASFSSVQQVLNENMTAKPVDIKTGRVPEDIDLLMVMAPENIDEKSRFAIDQFLMKGGTVVAASSPFKTEFSQRGLNASNVNSGLEPLFTHYGISVEKNLVLDPQSTAFPLPVPRRVGMFTVQEMRLIDYPYFIDVRDSGLNSKNPTTAGLHEITIPWASPIAINQEKNSSRDVVELVKSSPASWLSSSTEISPKVTATGVQAFNPGESAGSQVVAASITGRFESFYQGKTSPLLAVEPKTENEGEEKTEEEKPEEVISSIIEHSPESARLIVIASNSFAEDRIAGLLNSVTGSRNLAPFQLLTNAVEWSLGDQGLQSIRSRSHFNRTLPPLSDDTKQFWEAVNYMLALVGIVLVFAFRTWRNKLNTARYRELLAQNGGTIA